MAEPRVPRPDRFRLVGGCVLALVLGILSPLLNAFLMLVFAVPVLLAFLYAYAGLIPAALFAASSLAMALLAFGGAGLGMTLAALVLPGAAIIGAIRARASFRTQLVTAITALIAGMVAALAIAYFAIGSDIIDAMIDYMKRSIEGLPSNGMIDVLLSRFVQIPNAPTAPTAEQMLEGFLTEAERADYLSLFINQLHISLSLTLPGALLSAAGLSGVLAVGWSGRVLRHSIPEGDPARLPLHQWHTPYGLTLGLLGTLAVAYVLSWQKVSGGDTVLLTMQAILITCFEIQAVISAERRLRAFGAKPAMRVVVILLALIFLGEAAAVYGGMSALFGTTGAIRQLMAKRAEKP